MSDILDFNCTNSLAWEQLEYGAYGLKNLHYGLIHNGLSTCVDTKDAILPVIKQNCMPKNYTECQNGDVAFADASEDTNDVAKCVEFIDCHADKVVCGLHTIHGRDKGDKTVVGFKGYAFSSQAFRHQIRRLAQGTKIYSISCKNFSECCIGIPSKEEQSKIARLLHLIDQRLKTQKKIIEDLKKLKSAIGNKLLHDCFCNSNCTIQLSSVLNERKEYNENDGTYPHGSLSKEGVTLKSERYDRDFLVKDEDKKYKVSHYNDICYNPANLKFGVISRNKLGSIIFSPIYVTYEINDKYNSEYIELLVTNYEFIGRVRKFEQGTVYERMAVSSEDFLSYKISFPSKKTQDKIADSIRAIDTKLQNELNILDYTEKQKNYLLSQLFI